MDIINQNTLDKILTEEFFVHFDLEGDKHQIPISQSIITEQSIQTIIQEINKHIFDNKLEIEILVDPVEPGSHLKKTIMYIGFNIIGLAILPDIANGLVMGLGDGRDMKELTRDGIVPIKELVKGFFEKPNQELIEKGINPDIFYKAYDAKNNFYQANIGNPSIRGIGFDNTTNFPITRNQFPLRVVDLNEKTSDIDPIDKFHELIIVASINTEEDKDLSRKVKDKLIEKRFDVYMNDKNFYEGFLKSPFFIRNMIVKVRYTLNRNDNGEVQIERKEIKKVYQCNDKIRYPLPEGAKIEPAPRKMEGYSLEEHNPNGEGTLFEGYIKS